MPLTFLYVNVSIEEHETKHKTKTKPKQTNHLEFLPCVFPLFPQ